MDIWHYNPETGALTGQSTADPSPFEPEAFLIPAYATEVAPPGVNPGQHAVWGGAAWAIEDIPTPEAPPQPTFADLQDAKRQAIRIAYSAVADKSISAIGATWDGGFDSAIKLDAAQRLAQAAGASDVTFFDAENAPHVLDFATAQSVVIAVASAFQTALATKQALMRAIADAQSESDLNLVEWPE